MTIRKKKDWKLIRFRKSSSKNKKYDAILKSGDKTFHMAFGDKRYQHYKDSTGLGLYSNLDHNDKKRRSSFIARMKGFVKPGVWSPAYFAIKYLW